MTPTPGEAQVKPGCPDSEVVRPQHVSVHLAWPQFQAVIQLVRERVAERGGGQLSRALSGMEKDEQSAIARERRFREKYPSRPNSAAAGKPLPKSNKP